MIRPTAKQIEAHNLLKDNTIVLYGGAIRGAKSYWGCLEIISLCFQYPNSRWLLLRESWGNVQGKLLLTFNENFIQKGFGQYVKEFNKETYTLTWTNGSQIVFMAESFNNDKELNRFRGLEINGAFLDEVNEIREETFDKIIERSGSWFHAEHCPIKILMSCNPTQGWVKDRFYDPWKLGKLPKGIAYIQALITDNPYIPKEYLESLKLLPRYKYEVFVMGNWDISLKQGGEFYKEFEMDKHVEATKYDPLKALHISWDENVNPYLPVGIFQIDGKIIRMIDEITGVSPNNTVKWVCGEIKKKYYQHRAGMFIYGDATSRKSDVKLEKGYNFFYLIQNELAQFTPQLRVPQANPSVVTRGMFINEVLRSRFGDISVKIGEHCKKMLNDILNIKEAEDGSKSKEMDVNPTSKVRFQKYGHFTDLFDYLICEAFRTDFLTFQRGDMSMINRSFGRESNNKSNKRL